MVFSSSAFLFAFLPAVLVLTWAAPARARRFVLLGASTIFYFWGVQEFLFVVLASTVVDWILARAIESAHEDRGRARLLLVVAVLQNLALLGIFKYAGFASEQIARLTELLGAPPSGVLEIALPLGISFFTFEKISYVVDVYRGDVRARRSPFDVLLFVALFPRSIAGPIVRLREIQDQLSEPRPRADEIREGAVRFAYGLSKKVLIADSLAPVADAAFATAAEGGSLSTTAAWVGLAAYTLQLYFDFSGYTDMAIGIGLMLGFRLPENFRRPYSSVSVTDFWRRWHMTLSRWFRDYVYIPLGGNRGSERATTRNLLAVFALTGLWHGAAWTFLLWGLYHGVWLLFERRAGLRGLDDEQVSAAALRRTVVVLAVALGWVLFRAESLDAAGVYYAALFSFDFGTTAVVSEAFGGQALLALAVGSLIFFLPRSDAGGRWIGAASGRIPAVARTATLAFGLPIALAFALSGGFSPFLYFEF